MELAFNYSMHPYDEADREGASIITTFGITHNGMLDHMVIGVPVVSPRSFHTHSGAVFSHPIFFSDQILYCSNIIIIISGKLGYKNSLYLYYIQNISPEIEIFDLYVAYKK